MELEELNKSQIVLLTLLVSFVTSIATGIVTVSLMEQAPSDVTRVIQKTVERTVEKVAPPEIQTKIITKEKTVIVSDSDLIASAVELNSPSLVHIYTDSEDSKFVALGIVISSGGVIATDASKITEEAKYKIRAQNSEYTATVLRVNQDKEIALLELAHTKTVPRPASIATSRTKLGGSAVLLSGLDKTIVKRGLITELGNAVFATDISSKDILAGAVLINTDGNVIGISTGSSRTSGAGWFIPARSILTLLKATKDTIKDSEKTENATTTEDGQQAAAAKAVEEKDNTTENSQK